MNTKNRLIQKLLGVAKKHKVLTYPVIALVAIISAVSNLFSWGTGAGKRVVAVVMVMVMLVSQSYFLTSSATEAIDDEQTALVQQELQQEEMNKKLESEDKKESTDATTEATTEVAKSETSANDSEEIIDDQNMSSDDTATQAVEQDYAVTDGASNDNTEISSETGEILDTENIDEYSEIEDEEVDSKLEGEQIQVRYKYTGESGEGTINGTSITFDENATTYSLSDASSTLAALNSEANKADYFGDCYNYTGWFYDESCSEPVDIANADASKIKTVDGAKSFVLYSSRTLTNYRVTLLTNGATNGQISGANIDNKDYLVPVNSNILTITNLAKTGYDVAKPTIEGGNGNSTITSDESGTHLEVTFFGSGCIRTLSLNWTGKEYKINYSKNDTNDIAETQTVHYDNEEETFMSGASFAEHRNGWEFSGWKIGTDGTEVTTDTTVYSHQAELFETNVILHPTYSYVDVEYSSTLKDTYEYKEEVNTNAHITAKYSNGDSPNFIYYIDQNAAERDELASYGIELSGNDSQDGIFVKFVDGYPKKVTSASGIPIKFHVKDTSLEAAGENPILPTQTFYIIIQPKVVRIEDSSAKTTKPYDGTTDTILTSGVLSTNIEGVTVNIDTTKAKYNSEDVATADRIDLLDAYKSLSVPAGEDPANYVLNDVDKYISATITPRPIFINTTVELSEIDKKLGYVRAGEENPDIDFEEDTNERNDQIGLINGDTLEDIGVSVNVSPSRDGNLEAEGKYNVLFTQSESSNYSVKKSNVAEFTVKHQSPTGLYQYDDGKALDDWHIAEDGVTLSANSGSGYDTVLISRDGGSTFPENSNKVTEEDTGKTLYIKLKDSSTGAITSAEPFNTYCDATPPQYVGYTISEVSYESGTKPGLYFPSIGSVLDFGTYIKSTMTIRIQYNSDDTSKVQTLHYGLFGDSPDTNEVPFDNNGFAEVTIVSDAIENANNKAGIIQCYATDISGNRSVVKVLSPLDDNNLYEWSVENGAPEVGTLFVYAGEDKNTIVADQSGVEESNMAYYNHCEARVTVSDAVSGLEKIVWNINGVESTEEIHDTTKKSLGTYTHGITGANSEVCTVFATVYDNAGNDIETNKVTFRLDDTPPNLSVDFNDDVWSSDTTISFTTSDDLSGVDYAKVTDADGNTIDCNLGKPNGNGEYTASFEADKKGTYSVLVADKAGNVSNWTSTVTKISTEVPPCPTITVKPEEANGENGWFNGEGTIPVVTITNPQKSDDNTPVITQYRIWKEGETGYNDTTIENASLDVPLTDEGVFNIKAWTRSVSGIECAEFNNHVEVVKVDRTAPDISISTEKGDGASVIVHFTVSDNVSGVDDSSIAVMHGDKSVDITKEETANGVIGTFEITEKGNYTIQAKDNAGNESDKAAFTPMSLKVKAVTNITDTGATIGANVIKGTFDVKSVSLAYRPYSEEKYTEAEAIVNVDPETGNAAASAVLSDLTPNTPYVFKVTAVSEANEVLEYEGYFKTISPDQGGIAITGTARYADESAGNITVGIFEGNVCLMAEEIAAGTEFSFINIPDGNYNITATDGNYSKTTRLLVEDGMVVYPTQYIDLVLSGQNTSVVITTESTPNITADDMDTIFASDKVNFTQKDSDLIDAGGTVEFKLYATLMTVSSVSADEISAMYAVTDNNKVVGAYLDLSLYKIVTDVSGEVERSRVTNLANPAHISVTIPLGELAGKPDLEVVRIHNDGENFIGASLTDQDSNPNTYTITTDQFSTYAVLYSITGATSEEPTTAATEQPTTAPVNVTPSTQTVVEPSTQQPTPSTQYSYEDEEDDDEDVKEIKDKKTKPKSSSSTSVGSLTSSGSAKTGDETPIVIMFALMMMSICGMVVLRKKSKKL